jgi:hypothetical protein
MIDCPKFQTCNAPICPLDREWQKRSLHNDDATCFYLMESVKAGAEARFQLAGLGEMYSAIGVHRPTIIQAHKRINSKVEAAKLSGSRMDRKAPVRKGA